jgi:RND family efflux transporter MFP subunit
MIRNNILGSAAFVALAISGCQHKDPAPAARAGGMQGMPVQTVAVSMEPVPESSEYVATIKSRRSATLQPQVSGTLTQILVKSGDRVTAGQVLMTIDPKLQVATVEAQQATERQKKAVYDYNKVEVERQRKLFEAGVTSRDAFDQAQQAYDNSKADYQSAADTSKTQQEQLAYYTIRSPYDGVVGDIPVHVGDYVSPSSSPPSILTTVDENKDLEAYIYIPTERVSQLRMGLNVDLTDISGKLLEKTKIDFISPQVDSNLQGILAKAPVHATPEILRNAQLVKARVIWSTAPMAVVPVLSVVRQGGQSFVFLATKQNGHFAAHQTPITLGDTVGNAYSVQAGLSPGDKVIITNTQFLVDGMPVMPMGG